MFDGVRASPVAVRILWNPVYSWNSISTMAMVPPSTLTDTADQSFLRCSLQNSVVAAIVHFADHLILFPLSRAFKWLFKS
nr:hypothetical protein Iba_chr14dCG2900 [Ipomoea batatas]